MNNAKISLQKNKNYKDKLCGKQKDKLKMKSIMVAKAYLIL